MRIAECRGEYEFQQNRHFSFMNLSSVLAATTWFWRKVLRDIEKDGSSMMEALCMVLKMRVQIDMVVWMIGGDL